LRKSKYFLEHTSDVYRLILLWKYGGTYLDTDIIVRRPIAVLGENFVCAESKFAVSNAVINFNSNRGYRFVLKMIEDQISNFNGSSWGGNGPMSMTRVLQTLCQRKQVKQMVKRGNCNGFHVKPPDACYPLSYAIADNIFNASYTDILLRMVEHSVTVHIWNAITWTDKVEINERTLYTELAREFCPRVFNAADKNF
jgi:lactosylceramide 4-alpha-galactosyltransferase